MKQKLHVMKPQVQLINSHMILKQPIEVRWNETIEMILVDAVKSSSKKFRQKKF